MDIRDTTVILLSTILLLILCQLRLVRGYDVAQISPIPRGQLWFRNFNASTPNNLAAASPRDYNFDSMNCGGVTVNILRFALNICNLFIFERLKIKKKKKCSFVFR